MLLCHTACVLTPLGKTMLWSGQQRSFMRWKIKCNERSIVSAFAKLQSLMTSDGCFNSHKAMHVMETLLCVSMDVRLRENHQMDPCGPTGDGATRGPGTDQTLVPIVNSDLDSCLSINITANPAYLNGDGRLGSPLLSFWDWVHNMRLSISFTPSHRQNIMVKFNCWQHAWRGIAMPQFTSKGL